MMELVAILVGRSLPGAVSSRGCRLGIDLHSIPERLRKKMQELTKGGASAPIVAVGWNSERFNGRNLALRLMSLGHCNVYCHVAVRGLGSRRSA